MEKSMTFWIKHSYIMYEIQLVGWKYSDSPEKKKSKLTVCTKEWFIQENGLCSELHALRTLTDQNAETNYR